ncbi:hypothetical protein [Streptomyces sp. NPDC058664]|uniref:hypothetical protein n=1 Tax=unclassified Streptomyces TaxID=2593676 RepID=UPI00365F2777
MNAALDPRDYLLAAEVTLVVIEATSELLQNGHRSGVGCVCKSQVLLQVREQSTSDRV